MRRGREGKGREGKGTDIMDKGWSLKIERFLEFKGCVVVA
jgi:hypothetical protein